MSIYKVKSVQFAAFAKENNTDPLCLYPIARISRVAPASFPASLPFPHRISEYGSKRSSLWT